MASDRRVLDFIKISTDDLGIEPKFQQDTAFDREFTIRMQSRKTKMAPVEEDRGLYGNAYHRAAAYGDVRAIDELAQSGHPGIDEPTTCIDGFSPVYLASLYCNVSAVEALVRNGSKAIDIPTECGFTPLYIAAKRGGFLEEVLRDLGAKANKLYTQEQTKAIRTKFYGAEHPTNTRWRSDAPKTISSSSSRFV